MRPSFDTTDRALVVPSGPANATRARVFQTDSTTKYLAADQIAGTDWDAVKSVQIWLLMRASVTDSGYQNNNTYTLGTLNITANDGYRRLLLSTVVNLRN